MELSIVSLGTVQEGATAADAYSDVIDLAQRAEALGYSRFWVAEHHGVGNSISSSTPEVMIGHLAAETDEIRLGSGTILLNHYSPYKVAETFSALDALAHGRIDMGLGRASGSPAADQALQYNQNQQQDDHADKIEEAVKHLYDGYPDDHPYGELHLPRSGDSVPETWVLGSSPNSAAIAGRLGLPYCFAGFIRPDVAPQAFEAYREHFDPAPFDAGPDDPEGMLGLNVTCAETDQEAARLRSSVEAYYQRLNRGDIGTPPAVEEAIDELGGVPDPTPRSLEPGAWPRQISGSPDTVRDLLEQLTDQVGVDEVVVQNLIEAPDDRVRSYELIAEGVGLSTG